MSIAFSLKDQDCSDKFVKLSRAFQGLTLNTKEQNLSVPFFGSVTLTFSPCASFSTLRELHSIPSVADCIVVKTTEGVGYEISIQNVAAFEHKTTGVCSITFATCWIRLYQLT